jgi:hypothetical protein
VAQGASSVHDMTAENKCGCQRQRPTVAVQLASLSERAIRLARGGIAGRAASPRRSVDRANTAVSIAMVAKDLYPPQPICSAHGLAVALTSLTTNSTFCKRCRHQPATEYVCRNPLIRAMTRRRITGTRSASTAVFGAYLSSRSQRYRKIRSLSPRHHCKALRTMTRPRFRLPMTRAVASSSTMT